MTASLLLVVVFLTLGYQSFKASEDAAFSEFNQRQLVLSKEASRGIELYFEAISRDLGSLASLPEIQSPVESEARRELRQAFGRLEQQGINDIGVLDANGILKYSVMAPQIEGDDFSWRRYFQEAREMASADSYIIEFIEFKGVEAGDKGVLVAVPMVETHVSDPLSSQFAGVIVGTLKLGTITGKFVAPIKSSERGHTFLIDDEHNVLWASDRSLFGKNLLEEAEGFPEFQRHLAKMAAGDTGTAKYSFYDFDESAGKYTTNREEESLTAYAPIRLGNETWSIGVSAPKDDARQLIQTVYLGQLLVVGLSIMSVVFGAAYTLARLKESYGRITEEQGKVLAAIEASSDPIWVSDANRRLVMVNSAMEELVGRPKEQLLGQTCRSLLNMRSRDGAHICQTMCPLEPPIGGNGRVEACLFAAGGDQVWSEISFGQVLDADGRLAAAVHVAHDLTERKEVERLKDEFISMVSHELRTPLNHIKGFATTLLQTDVEWDAATEYDFLETISNEADRLTNLVEKILHLSRLESDGLPMEKEWNQIYDLVDGALQRRRRLTHDRNVALHVPPGLPALYADGREIEVVLMNLIENAIKYSDPETPVTLGVECQDDLVTFSVADQGIGVSLDDAERIFDRFYRVEDVAGRKSGTGLGLAICKGIVEAHGGRIWVESTPGSGSRFYFSLPVEGAT